MFLTWITLVLVLELVMHSNKKCICSQVIISGLFISCPALADIDELYQLSIGASLESYNSDLSVNSNDTSKFKAIDFENDLGYNKRVNAGWISGWYRVGDHHRLRITYTPLKRSATATNKKDIVIDNTTIKAGATIAAETKAEILDLSYIYSFYKSPQIEMGLSAGIYWLFNDTKLLAAGEIQAEGDDQPTFQADFISEQKLQAPMPLIGFSANYEIIPSWRSHAAVRYLSVQINETDGRIFSTEIGTEFYFNKNFGIGASLSAFTLQVNVKGIIANTALGWEHDGIQIYAVFKY